MTYENTNFDNNPTIYYPFSNRNEYLSVKQPNLKGAILEFNP